MASALRDRDGGYGVCGAKNVYTSSVRIGNWLEDSQGQILQAKSRAGARMLVTEQRDRYNPLEQRTRTEAPPSLKFASTEELIAKNKEGSPYALLFNHGKDIGAEVSFVYAIDAYRCVYSCVCVLDVGCCCCS